MEEINDEIQRRIKRNTGKESKIAITAHIPTLSATVEISTPGYAVDIYNSSIRTVLGWPAEKPDIKPNPPEPKKSDFMSDKMSYHSLRLHYNVVLHTGPPGTYLFEMMKIPGISTMTYYDDYKLAPEVDQDYSGARVLKYPFWKFEIGPPGDEFPIKFYIPFGSDMNRGPLILLNMRDEFDKQLKLLGNAFHEYISDLNTPRDKIIRHTEIINQIIDDMKYYNRRLLRLVRDAHDNKIF